MRKILRVVSQNETFVLVFSLLAAILISLSPYHIDVNADTLVNYLIALVKWTPFYWSQDRYGMLIPLVSSMVKTPVANVIFQHTTHITMSLLSFFLLANFLFPRGRWVEIGLVSIFFFVILNGTGDLYVYMTPWQIYTPALFFGLLGLRFAERSFVLSLLLLATAHWCNFSVGIFLSLLVLVHFIDKASQSGWPTIRRPFLRTGALLTLAWLVGSLLRAPFKTEQTEQYTMAPILDAITGWVRMVNDQSTDARGSAWILVLPLILGTSLLAWRYLGQSETLENANREIRSFVGAILIAFVHAMAFGFTVFASSMGYPRRYLITSLMVWCIAWAGLFIHLSFKDESIFRRARGPLAFGILLLVVLRFGPPNVNNISNSFETRLLPKYQPLAAAGCTHVVGNYYRVWEAVSYARFNHKSELWGITHRANATQVFWNLDKFKNAQICYWRDDKEEAKKYLKEFGIYGFRKHTDSGPIVVLRRDSSARLQSSMEEALVDESN